ncbi:hypothetical protein SAMN05421856_101673 [Chryseobacterium taichungense]|uniref:Uncharacterized protein n=1 Tax=Chryseobacterium taichungense TaxID=295069 RepID=A0A1H7WF57_9FLAO|nr:hypothetical protein [Chryseobacterium taichungense]SEM19658.1 hypothetical protein SAMN05421856_101673 [Chryseobacterium taichungense]
MKRIYSIFILVVMNFFAFGQETITSATAMTSAAEGNLYKATDDGQIYFGLRNGLLCQINPFFSASIFSGSGTLADPYRLAQMGATNGKVLSWNNTTNIWSPSTDAATSNWFLAGNTLDSNANSFLGTKNNIRLQLRSNNTPMLEVGTRQTLGLYNSSNTALYPYNQSEASLMYIRGTNGNSALQFEANGASYYKPVFYTDGNGNFIMRGSAASSDFFELGSGGSLNNGSFNFLVGDDGNEPFVFSKFNYTSLSYVEMMRVQGTGLNNSVRIGINMNGTVPNSTLQVSGSISLPIVITSSAFVLTEKDFTVILGGNHNITLPNASECTGRMYIIKNPTSSTPSISNYKDIMGADINKIAANSVIWIKSINNVWEQIK